MSAGVERRLLVERRLRIVGLVLLGVLVAGYAVWIVWITRLGDTCSTDSGYWTCLEDDRLRWQYANTAGLVLLVLAAVVALWWGLVGFYRFRVERIRRNSILESARTETPTPLRPDVIPTQSAKVPPRRPGYTAVLTTAAIAGTAIAVPTIIGFIRERHRLSFIFSMDYRKQMPSSPLLVLGSLLTLVCLAVIWRILWLMKSDRDNTERRHQAKMLSDKDALAVLRPPKPPVSVVSDAQTSRRRSSRRAARTPSQRHVPARSTPPSTHDLTRLYSRERRFRIGGLTCIALAILVGYASNRIYDSAGCLNGTVTSMNQAWHCQLDPTPVLWSRIVAGVCFLVFTTAVSLWWTSVVVQGQARRLEERLGAYEQSRVSNEGIRP